jgi:hypothetical protein
LNYVDLSDKNEGSKRRILEDLMMVREVLQVLPKDRGFEMLYRVEMGLGSAVALPAGARLDHYENASALCRQAGQAETQNALLAYYHSIALVMASGSLGTVKNLRQASSYIKPLQRMASGVRTKLERKLSLSQGDLALQIAEWGKRVDPAAILEMMQKLASTLQAKPTEASGASRDALVLASAQGAASSAPSDDPSLVVAGEHLTHHAS